MRIIFQFHLLLLFLGKIRPTARIRHAGNYEAVFSPDRSSGRERMSEVSGCGI